MGSKLSVFLFGSQQLVADIIARRSTVDLDRVLQTGWDVNEVLNMSDLTRIPRTALCEAAKTAWTEGVKMLLDAGAECKMSDALENPLTLALQNPDCPPNLIQLVLQHGADPNDHDGRFNNIPLMKAIANCRYNQGVRVVELLLEYGADPGVAAHRTGGKECALSAALHVQDIDIFTALFRILVMFGADVNYNVDGTFSLLCRMLTGHLSHTGHPVVLREQLDLFFLHGGNINIEDVKFGTALEYAVRKCGDSNGVRWLVRHGADTSPIRFTLLKEHFTGVYYEGFFPDTPVILLQAGMRVAPGAQTQLSNMQVVICTWLQEDNWSLKDAADDDDDDDDDLFKEVHAMWAQVEEAEGEGRAGMRHKLRTCTFAEYWSQQMADLQKFSDESLHVYPENTYISHTGGRRQQWLNILDQIQRVLRFLSQPQSLQWYCRYCVRESLVSLQPSVVKTLPIPARLKQYILYHEI